MVLVSGVGIVREIVSFSAFESPKSILLRDISHRFYDLGSGILKNDIFSTIGVEVRVGGGDMQGYGRVRSRACSKTG